MDAQDRGGVFRTRAEVIGQSRFIGCADFANLRAGSFDYLANAETAADLNELAARDNDLRFFPGKMPHDQHECGGAIVDDGGGFGAAENRQISLEVLGAIATLAGAEIELDIAVAGRKLVEQFARAISQRRASEVGVQN